MRTQGRETQAPLHQPTANLPARRAQTATDDATSEGLARAAEEQDPGARSEQRHHRDVDEHLVDRRALLHGCECAQRRHLPEVRVFLVLLLLLLSGVARVRD
jgi:hypothetical protein